MVLVPTVGADTRATTGKVPRLVFPLVAKTVLWDNYGDPRGNGRHAGIDMENPWRAPVVAVEPGRVEYATSGLGGCMLYLYGRSGTMYLYIHLNNDLTPKNDNKAGCVQGSPTQCRTGRASSPVSRSRSTATRATRTGTRTSTSRCTRTAAPTSNPFPHLKKASKLLFAGREGAAFSLGMRGRLLAAADDGLRLSATHVRSYPGGSWLEIDERAVDLLYAPDLTTGVAPRRAMPKPTTKVAVFTAKAEVTRDALAGAPGTLTVTRLTPLAP